MYSGSPMGRMAVKPAGQIFYTPEPASSTALRDMRLSCAQWLALSSAWKLAMVRSDLEKRGFSSLNNSTRGQVVYDLVAKLDVYCGARVQMQRGVVSPAMGVNMPTVARFRAR